MSAELPRKIRACSLGLVTWLACGLVFAGCSLFENTPETTRTTANRLPPLRPPPGAMQLDVAYIEWPADDSQLGQELWRHVDQVGPVEAQTRGQLRQNGFRVGVVGTDPPPVLQRMIGMKSDFALEPEAEQAKQISGRRFMLVSGTETDVQVSNPYPSCTLELKHGDETESRTFANAICKYRIKAYRIQDGWARLEFTPQIHHGEDQLRPEVGANGWTLQNGQLTESFRPQRFTVDLKTGDMAIVTAEENSPGTLGQLFFRGPAALRRAQEAEPLFGDQPQSAREPDYPIQRLLIVRLAGMDELEAVTAGK